MRKSELLKSELTSLFRDALPSEQHSVAKILSVALAEDPMLNYLTSKAADVRDAMEVYFRFCFQSTNLRHVEAGGHAAALWVAPGFRVSVLSELKMVPDIIRKLGFASVPICLKTLIAMDRMHPKEPHYYLMVTGVVPEKRNQGLGARLLLPVLDRCDREKVGAYLETSNPLNHSFYERLGFTKTRYTKVAADAPQMWAMWRDPR